MAKSTWCIASFKDISNKKKLIWENKQDPLLISRYYHDSCYPQYKQSLVLFSIEVI